MTTLYLSRARLRRDAPLAALAQLLVPDAAQARAAASHHIVWSLFADGPDRQRDFLWREDRPGEFLTLSPRPPADPHGLFDLDHKPFEPALRAGDRLGFSLRANPVIARPKSPPRPGQPAGRGQRHDVVMDALFHLPPGEARAEARPRMVAEAGNAWLARQGAAHGFTPEQVAVDGYDRLQIPRGKESRPAVLGVLDLQGTLRVEEPVAFLAALAQGFGRGKAFGCGLMLIRRAF
jgi:CRISPR system Cascade subunit CasE